MLRVKSFKNKSKKLIKIVVVTFAIVFIVSFPQCVKSLGENTINQEDIYNKQLEQSNANNIYYSLPQETKDALGSIGINSVSFEQLNSLSFGAVLNQVIQMLSQNSTTPVNAVVQVVGIMLLCALINSMKTTLNDKPLGGIVSIVGTLCVCSVLVFPITQTIFTANDIIKTSASFMLIYVPILAGVLIASGNALVGGTYYSIMMGAGQSVTLISANFIVPIMNVFLGISVISAISTKIKLDGVCTVFAKITKWVLTFVMSIFVSILSFQTIISAVADKTSVRATKFAISSVVPVVGGALSDAFLTVQSCITMLKSGVGVFVIIACMFIFLPIVLQCGVWLFTLNVCNAIGEIFDVNAICKILTNASKVISTLLAILLCFMAVFIISSTLILIVGSN